MARPGGYEWEIRRHPKGHVCVGLIRRDPETKKVDWWDVPLWLDTIGMDGVD